ncbi:MAG TPA: hypothetical protein DDW90_07595 [Cyanobacteria bacterium UBA9971]|nr:hypothetical protein [Cyanobacteria bacterium UBA9971]
MQFNEDSSLLKNDSVIKKITPIIIWAIIIGITANFVKDKKSEASVGKDVIRCIIDENASNLDSPACKRVISRCSNDTTGSCKKLLFYSDDGVHSEEALSILGNICGKGGEKACDILINRCIENKSNCEIFGKSYSIKNYLSMKADAKNTGKTVMYKKLKNYYEEDVDNIVSNVIQTCMTDKNSMACQIFTSKLYEFNSAEKSAFVIIQNSNSEIDFSKTGISLAINTSSSDTEIQKTDEEKADNSDSDKISKTATETELTEVKQTNSVKKPITVAKMQQDANNENTDLTNNSDKSTIEISTNKDKILDSTNKNAVLTKKQSDAIFKAILTTSEENNINYIKNKIYSFDISYKEPANTKIKWLISFDGKATWKKWDGNSWIQVDTSSDIKNINFSLLGNNSTEIINGLKDYILQPGETSLDFAVELISSDEISTPSIDRVEIKYY